MSSRVAARGGLHAQLHAHMALFAASTPALRFLRLRRLEPHDCQHVQSLAATMGLEVQGSESGKQRRRSTLTVRKPAAYCSTSGHAALVEACDKFGPKPLTLLLAEPLAEASEAADHERAAKSIAALVRTCAALGRLEPMVEALDAGTADASGAALARHSLSYNKALGSAMKALTNADRPRRALELFGEAVGTHALLPNSIVLMRLCIAARKHGRASSASLAVEQVVAAMEAGAELDHPSAVDAYMHCCALAGAARPALEAFRQGLALDSDESGRGSGSDAPARSDDRRHLHRLASLLSACARERDTRLTKEAHRTALEHGISLDGPCTNALISALARGGDFKSALEVYRRHLRQHAPPASGPASHERVGRFWLPSAMEVAAAAAEAYSRAEAVGEGRRGLLPTELTPTLNCALAATSHDVDLVFELLRDSAARGVTPDVFGLTAAINALGAGTQSTGGDGDGDLDIDGEMEARQQAMLMVFRWGMDIGIQPDAYLLQQMQDALTPADARDTDRLALGVAELLQAQPEMDLAAEATRSFGLSRAWTRHEGRDEASDAEERYSTGDLPPTASDAPTPVSVSDDPLASMSTFLRQQRMLSEEGASQDAEQSIEAPAAEETTPARTETGRIAWLLKAIGLDGRQK